MDDEEIFKFMRDTGRRLTQNSSFKIIHLGPLKYKHENEIPFRGLFKTRSPDNLLIYHFYFGTPTKNFLYHEIKKIMNDGYHILDYGWFNDN